MNAKQKVYVERLSVLFNKQVPEWGRSAAFEMGLTRILNFGAIWAMVWTTESKIWSCEQLGIAL